jgi:hypothetical protein
MKKVNREREREREEGGGHTNLLELLFRVVFAFPKAEYL